MDSPSASPHSQLDLAEVRAAAGRIRTEIHKIIVGQEATIDYLLAAVLARGHVLIEGVPGVAKTMMAKLLARAISVPFSRIQFTPDLMPSDILGTSVFNMKSSDFEFNRGPIFSSMVLVDEINRAPAKTQAALFEVMEEYQVTVDGTTRPLQEPFMVMATQNPIEHEGTYRLPEAQLDRFLLKVDIKYPSLEEETQILGEYHLRGGRNDLDIIQPVVDAADIRRFQNLVSQVHVEQQLMRYVAQIVHRTRDNSALYVGASPRASLGILASAKAFAALNGRDFVTPEDIRDVTYPVLVHRIQMMPEQEMEGVGPRDVVKTIIQQIDVPR